MNSKINNIQLWVMGLFLSVIVLIAKSLIEAGVHPVHVAFLQAAGSFLYLLLAGAGKFVELKIIKKHFMFFLIASLLGFTIPQLIVFSIVSHVGVGIASLSYALPLFISYMISLKLGLEKFNLKQLLFLVVSATGTFIYLLSSKYMSSLEITNVWIIVLLLSPISIGIANVYRTMKWPKDVPILGVAILTNACSSVTYILLIMLMQLDINPGFNLGNKTSIQLIVLMLLSGVVQYFLFALQKNAGPVFIGQTGSIVTLFGGMLGYIFYNDSYSYYTFFCSLLIFIGVYYYSKYKWFVEQGTHS
jgi:drug/metabolite transporter (DMT)-like permease